MNVIIYTVDEPRDMVRDMDMVLHPEKWPIYPILPLKHTKERDPECPSLPRHGFVFSWAPTTVIKVSSIYSVALGLDSIEKNAEETYKTVSEMLADWEVD